VFNCSGRLFFSLQEEGPLLTYHRPTPSSPLCARSLSLSLSLSLSRSYLERKLGLHGGEGSKGSSKGNKNWKRLTSEWSRDGLGDDFGDFLMDLGRMEKRLTGSGGGASGGDGESNWNSSAGVYGVERDEDAPEVEVSSRARGRPESALEKHARAVDAKRRRRGAK
jgi:hypothetical protein